MLFVLFILFNYFLIGIGLGAGITLFLIDEDDSDDSISILFWTHVFAWPFMFPLCVSAVFLEKFYKSVLVPNNLTSIPEILRNIKRKMK